MCVYTEKISTYRELEVAVILEEHRYRPAKILELQCADVVSIYEDIAFFGIVQAHCQFQNCALPSAVSADDDLARGQNDLRNA